MTPLRCLLAAMLLAASTHSPLAAAPVAGQRTYASPGAAADALLDAVVSGDRRELRPLFGVDTPRVAPIPDDETMADVRDAFALAWGRGHSVEQTSPGTARLRLGTNRWVYPVPIVRTADGRWAFDTRAGVREIDAQRIARNEDAAIKASLAYVDAQHEYARTDRDGDGVAEYARRLDSRPGRRDGLHWVPAAGEPRAPLGPKKAAAEEGGGGAPFHGYWYRILTAQGASARGGARDYLVDGRLLRGFALIATPAKYGRTGSNTFVVNHDGRVYSRDLGPHTRTLARRIDRFDPGPGWTAED
jgi:hypothetical protein